MFMPVVSAILTRN